MDDGRSPPGDDSIPTSSSASRAENAFEATQNARFEHSALRKKLIELINERSLKRRLLWFIWLCVVSLPCIIKMDLATPARYKLKDSVEQVLTFSTFSVLREGLLLEDEGTAPSYRVLRFDEMHQLPDFWAWVDTVLIPMLSTRPFGDHSDTAIIPFDVRIRTSRVNAPTGRLDWGTGYGPWCYTPRTLQASSYVNTEGKCVAAWDLKRMPHREQSEVNALLGMGGVWARTSDWTVRQPWVEGKNADVVIKAHGERMNAHGNVTEWLVAADGLGGSANLTWSASPPLYDWIVPYLTPPLGTPGPRGQLVGRYSAGGHYVDMPVGYAGRIVALLGAMRYAGPSGATYIDRYTRGITITVPVFNIHSHFLAYADLVCEFGQSGVVVGSYRVYTVHATSFVSGEDWFRFWPLYRTVSIPVMLITGLIFAWRTCRGDVRRMCIDSFVAIDLMWAAADSWIAFLLICTAVFRSYVLLDVVFNNHMLDAFAGIVAVYELHRTAWGYEWIQTTDTFLVLTLAVSSLRFMNVPHCADTICDCKVGCRQTYLIAQLVAKYGVYFGVLWGVFFTGFVYCAKFFFAPYLLEYSNFQRATDELFRAAVGGGQLDIDRLSRVRPLMGPLFDMVYSGVFWLLLITLGTAIVVDAWRNETAYLAEVHAPTGDEMCSDRCRSLGLCVRSGFTNFYKDWRENHCTKAIVTQWLTGKATVEAGSKAPFEFGIVLQRLDEDHTEHETTTYSLAEIERMLTIGNAYPTPVQLFSLVDSCATARIQGDIAEEQDELGDAEAAAAAAAVAGNGAGSDDLHRLKEIVRDMAHTVVKHNTSSTANCLVELAGIAEAQAATLEALDEVALLIKPFIPDIFSEDKPRGADNFVSILVEEKTRKDNVIERREVRAQQRGLNRRKSAN